MSAPDWVAGSLSRVASGRRVRPRVRAQAGLAAASGPGFWPSEEGLRRRIQERLSVAMPADCVGRVPVLACGFGQRSAWTVSVGGHHGEVLTGSARRAAQVARHEVARWTPLAWRMLPALDHLRAQRVDVSVPVGSPVLERPLTGDSLGLSVALAVVSAWIQLPVPGHLAASAAIASDGRLERVGRLADKVGLLRDLLPGVRTLAVASEQAEDWRRMVAQTAGVQVQVVGFPSVAAAITHFFAPGDALASVPASEHSRVVFGLSSLMARGQGALPDWKPVVSAVATIRAHWSLSSDDRHRLDLLDLVARRYAKLALPTAPPGGSLAELVDQASQRSALERGVHLALLVEHCSFLDLPLPASLAAAIRPHLDADLHPFSFDVRGAYARWQGTHDPVAALVAQQALLTELIAGRRLDSCSHALNEAIRLAAVLGDRTAFGHLLDTESRLHELGGLGPVDRTFVDAVVCGGAALLALPELSERRWARLAEGVGPKSYLQSWAHRMRCLSGLARAEDWPLLPHHLALHQLAQGDVTLDQACAALGSGRALAGRLAEQGVDHLLRFYPS